MSVRVHRQRPAEELGDAELCAAVEAALARGGVEGRPVDVVLTDDPTLADLHDRFLNDPSPTDVIAFELGEEGTQDGDPWAEIWVSVDRARAVAARRGVRPARELALYCVHGALHLAGYDDHEPEDRSAMRAAEGDVMRALGYEDDPAPHEEDA